MEQISRRGFVGGAAVVAVATTAPVVASAEPPARQSGLRPIELTTGHLVEPLGIDVTAPGFGWQLKASGTGRRQTAYRIRVATSRRRLVEDGADMWDSGKIASNSQSAVEYEGAALGSRTRYFWDIQAWDEDDHEGVVSRVSWFETALLSPEDWTAEWIGSGAELPAPTRTLPPANFAPTRIEAGHSYGQSFRSDSSMIAVTALFQVPEGETAGCRMILRRDGFDGEVIASAAVADLTGGGVGRLDLPNPAGPGDYFLEVTEPVGNLDWLGVPQDFYPLGAAFVDGSDQDEDGQLYGDRWLYGLAPNPPADPLLRTEFQLPGRVRSARLYLAGLGHGIAWINGRRVGQDQLAPPPTDYDLRILYRTHDVTRMLNEGPNALGVALGRGFFATRAPDSDGTNLARWIAEPQLLAQLEILLDNGQLITIGSSDDWKVTGGPTTSDGVFAGETYDARLAVDGWAEPGFDSSTWEPVKIISSPGGPLEAHIAEQVRAGTALAPRSVKNPADGVCVYDFGAVHGGWVRIRGRFPRGTRIRMLHGAKLDSTGRVVLGGAGGSDNPAIDGRFQIDEYVASGRGVETWQPSFTYKGFQYVEITGVDRQPEVSAVQVNSDLTRNLELKVDEPMLQWIADATTRTMINALRGQPEVGGDVKLGWSGAGHFASQPMLYSFGMARTFAKWLEDFRLTQSEEGEITIFAPMGQPWGFLFSPSSTIAYPSLIRRYWLHYGDAALPRRHFESVRRYLSWALTQLSEDLADDVFGDWYPPRPGDDPAPPEDNRLVGTVAVIESLADGVALAELVGDEAQARAWRERSEVIAGALNHTFFDAAAGNYRTATDDGYRQANNAIPLVSGLVPAGKIDTVVEQLAADVEAKDRHLNTGSVGTAALPYALSDHGHADLAVAVLAQRTYPSYGYLRDLGATTLWESWEADSRGHNDTTLSSPMRWLIERVAGVETLEPGWARFRVAPLVTDSVPGASIRLSTVRGTIESSWRRRGNRLTLEVRVPVNSEAEVILPGQDPQVRGSGRHEFSGPV